MSKFSPAAILYDGASHALKVVTDGADYVLGSIAKVAQKADTSLHYLGITNAGALRGAVEDASGNAIASIQDGSDWLLKNAAKVAQKADTSLHHLGITDAGGLRSAVEDAAGNAIASVQDGSAWLLRSAVKAAQKADTSLHYLGVTNAGGLRGVLEDTAGNAIASIQDGSDWLLKNAAKVAQKTDLSLHHLSMLDYGGVKATIYSRDGIEVAFPISSDDPSLLVNDFVVQTGGTDHADLRVDGSSTPVVFKFAADPTKNLNVVGFTFVIVANAMTFGSTNFAGLSALTNGVKVEVVADASTGQLALIKQNEDFLHYASIGGFGLIVANKDIISSTVNFGGSIRLTAGSSDLIRVTIQDDLSAGLNYFKCSVKAVKEP